MAGRSDDSDSDNEKTSITESGSCTMDFDDPADFVDDISDQDLLGDIIAQKPKLSENLDAIIIVDGIPVVNEERLPKLKAVIRKVFAKAGQVLNEHYATTPTGDTVGYAFLEFADQKQAQSAIHNMDGFKLDKQHTLVINAFADYDAYINAKDSDKVFQPEMYADKGNLRDWLLNPDAYDQYCVVDGGPDPSRVMLMLNSRPEPQTLQVRPRWSEKHVLWSPLGTFLTTLHREGILLWGGKGMKKIHRFTAPDVVQVEFSPSENYLVSLSVRHPGHKKKQQIDVNGFPGGAVVLSVWDVRTELLKRSFAPEMPLGSSTPSRDLIKAGSVGPVVWPAFKWAFDDKYLARLAVGSDGQPVISIYETPSFGLLDKKSVKVSGLRDFTWSPSDHIIAYYVAESKDVPARVTLIAVPSRSELRVKILFNVADCCMMWQPSTGDYLCLKVDRYSKMRKTAPNDVQYAGIYYNLEVFYMRAKQIPVDSVEIKDGGMLTAIAWEPQQGSRLALIHGAESANSPDYLVTVFEAGAAATTQSGSSAIVKKWQQRKAVNALAWSPAGQILAMCGLDYLGGELHFLDTADYTILASVEHYLATELKWDPTGRYLITGAVDKPGDGYWIWSSHGRLLNRISVDFLSQLTWRPRPPTLLSKKLLRDLRKPNAMKKYTAEFEALDQVRSVRASQQIIDRRRSQLEEWTSHLDRMAKIMRIEAESRAALRPTLKANKMEDEDQENEANESSELEEETVQFLVSVNSIVV